ncbi:MAG: sulfite exporter TauE/SafE family protein [Alphaproteobacteria bacterium]|nr:sulfite exporter TauE/SafE family protein [Alphaproteobacteria bacterium]
MMETELALLAIVLLVAGFLSGIVAGLLGVGGGMILVPVLFQTFIFFELPAQLQIHMAVATSMAIICFTGSLSARSHFRRGAVDVDVVKSWGLFIAIGALSGAVAARFIAPAGLKIIFATLALTMAARMLLNKNPGEAGASSISLVVQKGLASLVGFFSALMGIGGGTLSVPLLNASGRDVLRAVGTSSVFGVFIAVPAALGFMAGGWSLPDLPPLSFGYVNLLAVLAIIPTSMLAAPLGARLAHRLTKKALNNIFAGFLIVSGGRMLIAIFI